MTGKTNNFRDIRPVAPVAELVDATDLKSVNALADKHLQYNAPSLFDPIPEKRQPSNWSQERTCERCGSPFVPSPSSISHRGGRFCSRSCAASVPRPNFRHFCPESTKAERIRANGLVNMRLRRGWMKRPKRCQRCKAEGKRLDAHHPDYSKPDEVLFLCKSCHRLAHTDPSTVARFKPIKLSDTRRPAPAGQGPRPRQHGRGLPREGGGR